MGELEQLDRLQELRRHHQGLALANFQPLRQSHPDTPWRTGNALRGMLFA